MTDAHSQIKRRRQQRQEQVVCSLEEKREEMRKKRGARSGKKIDRAERDPTEPRPWTRHPRPIKRADLAAHHPRMLPTLPFGAPGPIPVIVFASHPSWSILSPSIRAPRFAPSLVLVLVPSSNYERTNVAKPLSSMHDLQLAPAIEPLPGVRPDRPTPRARPDQNLA